MFIFLVGTTWIRSLLLTLLSFYFNKLFVITISNEVYLQELVSYLYFKELTFYLLHPVNILRSSLINLRGRSSLFIVLSTGVSLSSLNRL